MIVWIALAACAPDAPAPAPIAATTGPIAVNAAPTPVTPAPETGAPPEPTALPFEEPTEPAYRTLRGRLGGREFVSVRAALIDDGTGKHRLDFYDKASNPARGACHPGGNEWETRMISLQNAVSGARSEPLFRVGETTTERNGALVVAHEWQSDIVAGARFRVRLTRLDREAWVAEGTVALTSATARIEGPFVARWCGIGRADPRPKPVAAGVEWSPDEAPAFDRIASTSAERSCGGRTFRPAKAVISRDTSGLWSLVLHDSASSDPCATLAFREPGVYFALGPQAPVAGFELVRRYGDPGDLRTTLQWDPEPTLHHSRSVLLSAVRIDAIADGFATGRIYLADDDENRTLVAGAFRATTCGF